MARALARWTFLPLAVTILAPMRALLSGGGRTEAVMLLFAGAVALLFAVFLAIRALIDEQQAAPTRRAIAHWLPIAITGAVAALLGSPEMGMGLVFGTSVAALSSVLGFVTLAGPLDAVPERARRIWPFLPVPVLLAFLVGFRGTLGLVEAAMFAAQGILSLLVWCGPGADAATATPDATAQLQSIAYAGPEVPDAQAIAWPSTSLGRPGIWTIIEVILALAVAAVAAWAVTRGASRLYSMDARYPTTVMAATLLSVALVMPMISTGTPLAATGRGWAPITAQAGVVLLNLGALLPAIILITHLRARLLHLISTTQPTAQVLYPRISWRIDAVVLLIVSFLFVPVALGKLRLSRAVGVCLITGYCIYLLTLMVFGRLLPFVQE